MEKVLEKKLRGIAKMLPKMQYAIKDKVKVTGGDLLLSGHTEVNGEKIEEKKVYFMSIPFYNETNHYRRLKRSYQKNGKEGVKQYIKPYSKNPKEVNESIDIIFG